MECVGELKLLAELIEARGIAAMREAISNTAELGAVTGGPRIVDDRVRAEMRAILAEIRSGAFAATLSRRSGVGLSLAYAPRASARPALPVERARAQLQANCSAISRSGSACCGGLALADRGALDIAALELAVRRGGRRVLRRPAQARLPRRRGARNSPCPRSP